MKPTIPKRDDVAAKPPIPPEVTGALQERMKDFKSVDEVAGAMRDLLAPTLQAMLEAELEAHLGYKKHERKEDGDENARNGYSTKTLQTTKGAIEVQIPRDREGTFEPQIVPKYGRKTTNEVEEKVLALYAEGNSTRDIQGLIHEIYGVEVSPAMISVITDKVEPEVRAWRDRPLSPVYPFVFLDGLRFHVKDQGRIINKCAYMVLALNMEGKRELLGIWIADSEGAKFWLGVLNDLKNRGVHDIVICTVDGLKGYSEAIASVFPETKVQRCIVHKVRSSMRFIPHKYKYRFCAGLRNVYTAPTIDAGMQALQAMKEKWHLDFQGRFDAAIQSWELEWAELSTFFAFSPAVRKMMYTTNGIESVHHQFRQITKTTSVFTSDESLVKLLWLGHRRISKKWGQTIPGWKEALSQLAIIYPDRLILN